MGPLSRRRAIPCLGCGYDLTGLPRDGVCPECALPLRDTLEEATLLRSIDWSGLCKLYLGIHLIAWSPILLVLSLPLAWVLVVMLPLVWGVDIERVIEASGTISGGLALASFGSGCVLLGLRAPSRSVKPRWTQVVTGYGGPILAVLLLGSPWIGPLIKVFDPWATIFLRAVFQLLALTFLVGLLRLCRTLETLTSQDRQRTSPRARVRAAETLVGLLAFTWFAWYWVAPSVSDSWDQQRGGSWGEGWAIGTLIALGALFWRVADAIALEWNVARYNREELDVSG
jgi:hypothetical protein